VATVKGSTVGTDGRLGTVLHAADLHLGAPLKALGNRLDAESVSSIRRQASRAFANLVDLAIAESVDVVVLAGDVYDAAEYDVGAQLRFVSGLERMCGAGTRVYIAHGNHDPVRKTMRLAAQLPRDVVVFDPGTPQVHEVQLRSGHVLHVAGVSFESKAESKNLAERFRDLPTSPESTVGVLHCNVGSQAEHGAYAPCTVEDLAAAPIGYWALGHIHRRGVNELGPGRWWAYPGNLQGRSAKATECGPKGVLLVPVLSDGFGEPEFRPCAEVVFHRVSVDVSRCDDVAAVVAAIDSELTALDDDAHTVVARVEVTGRSPAHRQVIEQGAQGLLESVREYGSTSRAAVTKVEISTTSHVERDQLLSRGDLLSAVLSRFDDASDTYQLVELVRAELDAVMAKRLDELIEGDPQLCDRIVHSAERMLIDLLEDVL
jgi:DNA repair protein SbcD/Mre11